MKYTVESLNNGKTRGFTGFETLAEAEAFGQLHSYSWPHGSRSDEHYLIWEGEIPLDHGGLK